MSDITEVLTSFEQFMDQSEINEESIFGNARLIEDSGERDRYVREACGANAQLEQRVRMLLDVYVTDADFLASPVETSAAIDMVYGSAEQAGFVIGVYQLVEQIGAGGMGLVFRAQQTTPVRRQVALKIIRHGLNSRDAEARFVAERQSLAQLNHPGIARLLDAGTTSNGRLFFVMELAVGPSITDFCRQNAVPLNERLRLFDTVCEAVHHAHQNGILHRDLKPGNVVVTVLDGRRITKVIDFGVASVRTSEPVSRPDRANRNAAGTSALSSDLPGREPGDTSDPVCAVPASAASVRPIGIDGEKTQLQFIVGTPAYMSPEQTELGDYELDARCDVYALGVLLYELLTDVNPFNDIPWKELSFTQILRTIREKSPQIPSWQLSASTIAASLVSTPANVDVAVSDQPEPRQQTPPRPQSPSVSRASLLKGDLDWITMKAVENDRDRRYASVAALAADLRRYLNHEPVEAGPRSKLYRLKKFIRRRKSRILTTMLAIGIVCMTCLSIGIGWSLMSHRAQLDQQRTQADQQLRLVADRDQAELESAYANDLKAAWAACLFGDLQEARSRLQKYNSTARLTDVTGFEWRYLRRICDDNAAILSNGKGHNFDVRFSPDSRTLVSCVGNEAARLDVWDVTSQKLSHTISDFRNDVNFAFFSQDGTLLLTADEDCQIRAWDVNSWKEAYQIDGFQMPLGQIFLASDNRSLIASEMKWSPPQSARTVVRDLQQNPVSDVRVLDRTRLLDVHERRGLALLVTDAGEISVRTFPGLETVTVLPTPLVGVCCGRISASGELVACGTNPGLAAIWRWSDWSGDVFPFRTSDPNAVRGVTFSPDEKFVAVCSGDGTVEVWDVLSRTRQCILRTDNGECWSIDISPDGRHLAVGEINGVVRLRNWAEIVTSRHRIIESQIAFQDIAVDSAVERIAIISADQKQLTMHSAHDGHPESSTLTIEGAPIFGLTFALDGQSLWATDSVGSLLKIDVKSMIITRRLPLYQRPLVSTILSSDGHFLGVSTAESGGSISGVWDLESEHEVFRVPTTLTADDPGAVRVAGFSDQSTVILTQSNDVTCFNFRTGREVSTRFRHQRHWISSVSPLPVLGDKTCSVCLLDGTVNLWHPETGTDEVLHGHRNPVNRVAVSPDGRTMATGDRTGEIRLWQLSTRQQLCELTGLTGEVSNLWFSPDGRRLLAAAKTQDGGSEVMVWNATESE
ncbi:MAG TPA: serine/threonine-protein kinase [Planctomycetaceae bacterium]|nr:serine/threonine-protein kinase [Planctomycetaceae bacterium]